MTPDNSYPSSGPYTFISILGTVFSFTYDDALFWLKIISLSVSIVAGFYAIKLSRRKLKKNE